ncbi:MAG: hypothetical protein K0S09_1899 [Sphingobacteriaceae bacterium]|jgi:hypothetical protein|nr:hypothetical protein [Sphingobacteriaceae bacterium]
MSDYYYIEVKTFEEGNVVRRLDASGRSAREQEKIELGLLRNLNQNRYYTNSFESPTQLKEI